VEDEVNAGIAPDRIAIGGFSQGGHISLKFLFDAKRPPAACIALSTWLEPTFNQEVTQISISSASQWH
jgi:predicted esterase